MAQQTINIGAVANDGTGDAPRTAATKINANFTELYSGYREVLTTSRTYYVDTGGSDSNTGLSPGVAFQTIQKAINVVADTLHIGVGGSVTIQLANGTYNENIVTRELSFAGDGITLTSGPVVKVTIQGNVANKASVILNGTGNATALFANDGYKLAWMTVQNSTAAGLWVTNNAAAAFDNLTFAAVTSYHVVAWKNGVFLYGSGCDITGGGQIHMFALQGGQIYMGSVGTVSNSVSFSVAFAAATQLGSFDVSGSSWSVTGTTTGKRYQVDLNSVLVGTSGNANFFPGTIAGTTATGGLYG